MMGLGVKAEDNDAKQLKECTIDNPLRPWNKILIERRSNESELAMEKE